MVNWVWGHIFANKAAMWTAIFTGVLSYFTILVYQVAKRSDDTSRASQRAFLSFANVAPGPQIRVDGDWKSQEFFVIWNNSGTTPAKAVVIQTNEKPFLEDLLHNYDFPLQPMKKEAVIGPKAGHSVLINIPRSQLEDLWRGRVRIFIWGSAIYKDIFPGDPDRLSEFCIEMTHPTVGWTVPPTVSKGQPTPEPVMGAPNTELVRFIFQSCSQHNCYDQDCKDYSDRVKDMR